MSRNEKASVGPTSPSSSTSPPGSFAYQTRLIENSLSRTSSLSRSGSITKGILTPSASRKFAYTHRAGSSVDSLRLERSRPIPENDAFIDVEHPIRKPLDASTEKALPETPMYLTRGPMEPPVTLIASVSLPQQPSHEAARPQQTDAGLSSRKPIPHEPLGDVGSKFATISHASSGEASFRPGHRSQVSSNDNTGSGSWSPASTATDFKRHRVTGSIDSVRSRWEERVREAETGELTPSNTGTFQRRGTTRKPQDMERKNLEASPAFNSPQERGISDRAKSSTLKRPTLPDPVPVTSIRDQWESRVRSQDDISELGQFPATGKMEVVPGNSIPVSDLSTLNRGSTARRNISTDAISSRAANFSASSTVAFPTSIQRANTLSSEGAPMSSVPILKEPGDRTFKRSQPSGESSIAGLRTRRSNSVDSVVVPPVESRTSRSLSSAIVDPKSSPLSFSGAARRDQYAGLGAGRRLGRHLPRIASGDAPDDGGEPSTSPPGVAHSSKKYQLPPLSPKSPEVPSPRDHNLPTRTLPSHYSPTKTGTIVPPVANASHVPGRADRIQLLRGDSSPTSAPAYPYGRNWIETQRQFIIAYEYLCHVGEAQQWIEGCLDEELPFGVVEMEEGLRNGVALARLARTWEGDSVVRKIFEHPRLQYRHSDNINIFLDFVRRVGLPEGFIFELTDLYEKKNIPKVIYCIHALSHLLARRGLAQRIGNLLGQLEFSDDQLKQTQKGLTDSGVAMPNFGNVGRELAREINEEPEEEPETEEERQRRLLEENVDSIIAFQAFARGHLSRSALRMRITKLRTAQKSVVKTQALCRGHLARRKIDAVLIQHQSLLPWVTAVQARARGILARREHNQYIQRVRSTLAIIIKVQAQARGILERGRFAKLKGALRSSKFSIVKLQAIARAKISRKVHTEAAKTLHQPIMQDGVIALQARARGVLVRKGIDVILYKLSKVEPHIIGFQACARGGILRRRVRSLRDELDDVPDIIVKIQSACRAVLARQQLLMLVRALRRAVPSIQTFQAIARAHLARQAFIGLNRDLAQARVVKSVGHLQTFARAALVRSRHKEQAKKLQIVLPDIVQVQAACRGVLVRDDYFAWRDYLHASQAQVIFLQSLLRGVLERLRYQAKLAHFQENLQKVVKIQALFRAKEQREQYRQLTMGTKVSVGTIKNFVHLLDDSEADFEEEIAVERLRKRVVEQIRENQALETEVSELDVKIALVVQNVKSFEDLIKARNYRGDVQTSRAVLAAYGDPFSSSSNLDHAAKRKLELYQQLFYLVQTKSEYFARLFFHLSRLEVQDKTKKMAERVVLAIFGYGQDLREDYLLLNLFRLSIEEEILSASTVNAVMTSSPMYISLAVHYVRPRQVAYVRDSLQAVIKEVVEQPDLDLETDPILIYRALINEEEMRTGRPSQKPQEVTLVQAAYDLDTRPNLARHLQQLQVLTNVFVQAIIHSTRRMPYGMRSIARGTLIALKTRFPNQSNDAYAAALGKLVFDRYINPAILAPETFDIVTGSLNPTARRNLSQISRVLVQIASGKLFDENTPALEPLNNYLQEAIPLVAAWFLFVADVPDAEAHFHAHEFLDVTVQPKPIYISPNEIYAMHKLLAQHLDILAPKRDDPLRSILIELDGVPNLGSDELKDARDQAITLNLTNRFAHVSDPRAHEKALWVQAKRGVLAVLRVQPAPDLVESLLQPVTDAHEDLWVVIVNNELVHDMQQQQHSRYPSAAVTDSAYRLEDIRTLPYAKVKENALYYLLELEKLGKITRADGYQGVLNAIAGDLRSKHRKRIQRKNEMEAMGDALKHLRERKQAFQEQISSYHSYIDSAMKTMQRGKGKKRFVLPFTKQFFHERELQKAGKTPQFGSYIFRAQELYDKGILLSIDQFSPRQFDRIDIVIESNEICIFNIGVSSNFSGVINEIASQILRMEDLLQANYDGQISLSLFDGMAKFNLNMLLFLINKK
ncbi:uncharacterized protein EI90DRAFT_683028 [Cantharellus anzutake]|uniref:uncharacterized protein n=1 Tax=Cantharellus anzutake TaxID=1750568 RepID=UPI00190876B7|nr:uncharacterized protein EI90DRAFT_683028 [Cantharellus anzutake]KAF8332668.1 hypothetical protein EI90DRAFT_683028 [Cantharellus anzutake]